MFMRNAIVMILLYIGVGCATLQPSAVTKVLDASRDAVMLLEYEDRTCSAFHIGDGQFLTAAHCFGDDLGGSMDRIRLISEDGDKLNAKMKKYDVKRDLALLTSEFRGPALQLWDNFWDGWLVPGAELTTLGYPGYYDAGLMFETGYVKDVVSYEGVEMIVSKEAVYSGESGGPVLSTANGKVVGMVHATSERIQWYNFPKHVHVTLSLIVSSTEIREFLQQ